MTSTKVFALGTFPAYKYVVTFSRMNGQWLFSQHKERDTWETQGGHIEEGETPLEAAGRELREESGAERFEITPVCDYWSGERTGSAVGVVFLAHVHSLGALGPSEMARVGLFEALPEKLTYPYITPALFQAVCAFEQTLEKNRKKA